MWSILFLFFFSLKWVIVYNLAWIGFIWILLFQESENFIVSIVFETEILSRECISLGSVSTFLWSDTVRGRPVTFDYSWFYFLCELRVVLFNLLWSELSRFLNFEQNSVRVEPVFVSKIKRSITFGFPSFVLCSICFFILLLCPGMFFCRYSFSFSDEDTIQEKPQSHTRLLSSKVTSLVFCSFILVNFEYFPPIF